MSATSADTVGSTARPNFGPRLAARVRPRAHVARQITRRATIGVVARSSLGFGRAVGMSHGSRPLVTVDTSTSTRLRPPFPVRRRHDSEIDQPAPAPSWTEQLTLPTRRRPPTSAGSPVRRAAGRSTATSAPDPAADEFVASGDRKLDALRRLLLARPEIDPASTSAPRSATPGVRRSPEPAPPRSNDVPARPAADPRQPADPEPHIGRRGDTTTGPGTAPGEVARRFRPEPVAIEPSKAVLPDAPGTAHGTTPPTAPVRGRRATRDPDSFRRMLEARGLVDPSSDPSSDAGPDIGPRPDPADPSPARRRSPSGQPARRAPATTSNERSTPPTRPRDTPPRPTPPIRRDSDTPTSGTDSGEAPPAGPVGNRLDLGPAEPAQPSVRPADPGDHGGVTPARRPADAVATTPVTDHHRRTTPPAMIRRRSIETATRRVSGADPLSTARPVDGAAPEPGDVGTVAPAAGGLLQRTPAATATIDPAPATTRLAQLRTSPHHALTDMASRSGLPHTQSDRRRPTTVFSGPAPDPAGTPRPIDGPASGAAAQRAPGAVTVPPATPPADTLRRATDATTDRPPPATPPADTLRRATDATTDRPPPVAPPIGVADRTGRDRERQPSSTDPHPTQRRGDRFTPDTHRAVTEHQPTPGNSPRSAPPVRRRLARPGRLGRLYPHDHVPVGLQRRSVVSPGPGALQRALAELDPTPEERADHHVVGTSEAPAAIAVVAPTDRQPVRRSWFDRSDPPPTQRRGRADSGREPTAPQRSATTGRDRAADTHDTYGADRTDPSFAPVRAPRSGPQRPGTEGPRRSPGTEPETLIRRSIDRPADPSQRVQQVADTSGRPAPPATSLADRFLHELGRQPSPPPQQLPDAYRPMAQTITGHHRVVLSVNDASRRALRSVGKVAATTDNVIHLDQPLAPGPRTAEVLAHELTHVAHPSPTPRFFDDDERGPEERRAEQVAGVMARAPLAPNGSVSRARATPAAPATTSAAPAPPAPDVIQRAPASGRRSPTSAGGITAAALAAQLTGDATAQRGSGVIRRETSERARSVGADRSSRPDVIRRDVDPDLADLDGGIGGSEIDFRRQLDEHFEYLLRRLERRMVVEMERRGGRFWRGV